MKKTLTLLLTLLTISSTTLIQTSEYIEQFNSQKNEQMRKKSKTKTSSMQKQSNTSTSNTGLGFRRARVYNRRHGGNKSSSNRNSEE
jgi:hypothetical protein